MEYKEYITKVRILKDAYEEMNSRAISSVQQLQQQIIQLQIITEELNWLSTQGEDELVIRRAEAIANNITKEG